MCSFGIAVRLPKGIKLLPHRLLEEPVLVASRQQEPLQKVPKTKLTLATILKTPAKHAIHAGVVTTQGKKTHFRIFRFFCGNESI